MDRELVALRDNAAHIRNELRSGRLELDASRTVERVHEVLCRDLRAVAEPEALANRERVRRAEPRDLDAGCNLGPEQSAGLPGLVRVVVELGSGRVLERPAGRNV